MNILFISHDASRTGAPLALLSLLAELKKQRTDNAIKIDVLLLGDGELCKAYAQVADRLFKAFSVRKQMLWRRLWGRICNRYHLIYANTVVSLPMACSIQKHSGVPVLLHVHESEYLMQTQMPNVALLKKCSRIIAVSPLVKEVLKSKYEVDESSITVVYPISALPAIAQPTEVLKHSFQLPSNHFVIGLVGSSDVWLKGIDLLPLVMKRCADKQPDAEIHFVWVGKIYGDTKKQLQYDLDKMGVAKHFTYLGVIDSPQPVYEKFDMLLLLSRSESFSLVGMECAQLGKPIVCMESVIGIADVLGPEAVITVPYLSIDAMADAILQLYSHKDLASRLGAAAHEKVQKCWSDNSEKLIKEIYDAAK